MGLVKFICFQFLFISCTIPQRVSIPNILSVLKGSQYIKPLKLELTYVNLSNFLPQFDSTFIILLNMAGLSIIQPSIPIMLTHLKYYEILVENNEEIKKFPPPPKKYRILKVHPQFATKVLKNGPQSLSNSTIECSSKYYLLNSTELCTKIKFLNFTTNIRPWNYELSVYLFPSSTDIEERKDFTYNWSDLYQIENLWVGFVNRARLFVVMRKLSTYNLQEYMIMLVSNGQYQEVLLTIMYTKFREKLRSLIQVVGPCSYCHKLDYTLSIYENLGEIGGVQGVFEKINEISVNSFNISNFNINVKLAHLLNDFITIDSTKWDKSLQWSVQEIFAEKLYTFLTILLGPRIKPNILRVVNDNLRPSLLLTKFVGYEFDSMEYSFKYSPNEIKFIGCGDTFPDRRSYFVLLASFDPFVWIMILIVLFICVPLALLHIFKYFDAEFTKSEYPTLTEVILASFKNLTEQSTPFPENIFLKEKLSLRLLASGMLLATLVISNAYKNDNINVLISPIPFRQFESFDQLVNSSYKVYAESSDLSWRRNFFPTKSDLLLTFVTAIRKNNHSVYTPHYKLEEVGKDIFLRIDSVVESLNLVFKQKHLKLPLQIEKYFNKSFMKMVDIVPRILKYKLNEFPSKEMITNEFKKIQSQQSLELLLKCNKTGILTYTPSVREYESRLKLKGLKKISIGTDNVLSSRIAVQPLGWVPLFVLRRLRGMEQSGIVDWWNKLYIDHLVSVRSQNVFNENQPTEEARLDEGNLSKSKEGGMDGNIFIIFIVYIIGCLVGFQVFIFETGILSSAMNLMRKNLCQIV